MINDPIPLILRVKAAIDYQLFLANKAAEMPKTTVLNSMIDKAAGYDEFEERKKFIDKTIRHIKRLKKLYDKLNAEINHG